VMVATGGVGVMGPLACWRGAWWRKTFNFSFMLFHLLAEFSIPH
jgi:hypothetical protein